VGQILEARYPALINEHSPSSRALPPLTPSFAGAASARRPPYKEGERFFIHQNQSTGSIPKQTFFTG